MFSIEQDMWRVSATRALLVAGALATVVTGVAPDARASCPIGQMWVSSSAGLDNGGITAGQSGYCAPTAGADGNAGPSKGDVEPASEVTVNENPYAYAYAYACGSVELSRLTPGTIIGEPCETAALACQFQGAAAGAQRLNVFRRLQSGGPWQLSGTSCGPSDLPPGAPVPPPIPTLAQIREAFLALPFAKPRVNVQPEGDVTLVNLPTYFEAQWPTTNLGPGEVSSKVQLLSWSIEFRIDPAEYSFHFGDGASFGPTKDLGGPHPQGTIRHTYAAPLPAAQVKVDATLTGSYRVNGGANWIPLGSVAELEDEPVTTLQVREAAARLYK